MSSCYSCCSSVDGLNPMLFGVSKVLGLCRIANSNWRVLTFETYFIFAGQEPAIFPAGFGGSSRTGFLGGILMFVLGAHQPASPTWPSFTLDLVWMYC